MGREVQYQTEVVNFFHTLDAVWVRKFITLCPTCHSSIQSLRGIADYHAEIAHKNGGLCSIMVECKAGETRFDHSQLDEDQIKFLLDYTGKWQYAYVWLMLGHQQAGSNTQFPRSVWLVPADYFIKSLSMVQDMGGVKYTPMNTAAIGNGRIKDHSLTAQNIYYPYRMEWKGNSLWIPNQNHIFWRYSDAEYGKFISARTD